MAKLLKALMLVCVFWVGGAHQEARAQEAQKLVCNSYSPLETMFKDVCWSGMFPMRLMGATYKAGKSGIPKESTNKILCKCGGDL